MAPRLKLSLCGHYNKDHKDEKLLGSSHGEDVFCIAGTYDDKICVRPTLFVSVWILQERKTHYQEVLCNTVLVKMDLLCIEN
jgi:hypothetical protein